MDDIALEISLCAKEIVARDMDRAKSITPPETPDTAQMQAECKNIAETGAAPFRGERRGIPVDVNARVLRCIVGRGAGQRN